jgi:DNA-binding response OmpR family regulator
LADQALHDRRILVVEDEYMLSEDVRELLEAEGVVVIGPVARVGAALALVDSGEPIDGAVLDINLQGEMVFPLAEKLLETGIPFLFATGYDAEAIPSRFAEIVRCEKPLKAEQVRRALKRLVAGRT